MEGDWLPSPASVAPVDHSARHRDWHIRHRRRTSSPPTFPRHTTCLNNRSISIMPMRWMRQPRPQQSTPTDTWTVWLVSSSIITLRSTNHKPAMLTYYKLVGVMMLNCNYIPTCTAVFITDMPMLPCPTADEQPMTCTRTCDDQMCWCTVATIPYPTKTCSICTTPRYLWTTIRWD